MLACFAERRAATGSANHQVISTGRLSACRVAIGDPGKTCAGAFLVGVNILYSESGHQEIKVDIANTIFFLMTFLKYLDANSFFLWMYLEFLGQGRCIIFHLIPFLQAKLTGTCKLF